MELIAASRIVKAQQRVAAARPYIEQMTAGHPQPGQAAPASTSPSSGRASRRRTVGFVVVTADRGLAGGYNANVKRAAERAIAREQAAGRDYRLIVAGKKGQTFFRFRNYHVDGVVHRLQRAARPTRTPGTSRHEVDGPLRVRARSTRSS